MKKILLVVLCALGTISQTFATPGQIRWGTTGDPLTGLTITWSNTGSKDSIKWGYTTAFEKGSFVGVKRAGYTSGTSFFAYNFGTVTASSTIYYKLYDSQAGSWGTQNTYATAPPLNTTNYSFCVLGDSRNNPSVLTSLASLAVARNPTFCLFNGDLTLSGTTASQFDTWFSTGQALLSKILTLHAEGNHDALGTIFPNLFDLPKVSGGNLYYSVKYGNAIFITINTNIPSDATQLAWLKSTLSAAAADPTITWKVVSCHHAFFTNGGHAGDMDSYRSTLWKAFDDYGVDLVVTGHDHNYQRSLPVNLNVSSSAPVAKYGSATGQGRLEVISGGAGASLYSIGNTADAWAMSKFNSIYNYTYFTVQGCKMKMYAYDNNNVLLDSLTLDKSGTTACMATDVPNTTVINNQISVYPNPAESAFTLHYSSELTGSALVEVYDMAGKRVVSEQVNKTQKELDFKYDMSKYPKGTYSVSVTLGGQKQTTLLLLSK